MDHSPHHAFEEIDGVFVEEFGEGTAQLFKHFEREPLAATGGPREPVARDERLATAEETVGGRERARA